MLIQDLDIRFSQTVTYKSFVDQGNVIASVLIQMLQLSRAVLSIMPWVANVSLDVRAREYLGHI